MKKAGGIRMQLSTRQDQCVNTDRLLREDRNTSVTPNQCPEMDAPVWGVLSHEEGGVSNQGRVDFLVSGQSNGLAEQRR